MNKTTKKRMLLVAMLALLLTNLGGCAGCAGCNVSVKTPELTLAPTATAAPTQEVMPTPTEKVEPTIIPTVEPVATPTEVPTVTEEPTITEAPVETPTTEPVPTETVEPTEEPTPTVAPTSTPEPTSTPTPTPSPVPTATPTPLPTATPVPTNTPTPVPTNTPTPKPTATPTPKPTATPKPTPTPTPVPVKGIVAGDYLTFGTYPQSALSEEELTDEIVNAEYAFVKEDDLYELWEANVDGKSYYKMLTYLDEEVYFTPEPIEWYVLETKDGKAFLLSKYILDAGRYDSRFNVWDDIAAIEKGEEYWFHATWKDCELRTWLNETFYERAFTDTEQESILLSKVKNDPNMVYGITSGPDTEDKVYLLSEKEMIHYFGEFYTIASKENEYICIEGAYPEQTTQFSATTDFVKNTGIDTRARVKAPWTEGNATYSLRTTGAFNSHNVYVFKDGFISQDGGFVDGFGGIRPCMWIDLTSADVVKVK